MTTMRMLLASLLIACGAASAQSYPDKSRPIKIIAPSGAASTADLLSRALGRAMAEEAGVTVVVENKPGAENVIGVQALLAAPPDGYAMLVNSNSSQTLNPVMIPDLKYDPLKDMQPVAVLGKFGLVMSLGSAVPFKSAREFIEAAKASPGKYTCAAATTIQRMGCELLQARAGIKLLVVPYKATAVAATALASGEADTIMIDVSSSQAHWQTGRVRPAAVTLSTRMRALPNVPTLTEEGVSDFNMTAWVGVYVPEKTPPATASALRDIVRKAARSKTFTDVMTQFQMEPLDITPEQINDMTRREIEMWRKIVRDQHIKVGG